LLDALDTLGIPRDVLLRIPAEGIEPGRLHAVLDGTPYAAAAEFADWTWGQTDVAFLDCDDELEIVDADWSEENVDELSRQWQQAQPLMERVGALEAWLESDPAKHFASLLDAALADPPDPAVSDLENPGAQDRRARRRRTQHLRTVGRCRLRQTTPLTRFRSGWTSTASR
jgi:hypothetical protein